MPPRRKPTTDPATELVLTDIAQLKAISDPLRLSLVEAMNDDPGRGWTARELAERLGTKQTKLYHHLNLLEEHGIVRIVETRVVSGIVEKRYGAVARSFRVDRSLLTGGESAPMGPVLDAIFEKARIEILEGVDAGLITPQSEEGPHRRMALWMTHVRLNQASTRKVMRLIEKLNQVDESPDSDGEEYGIVVGFYPRASKEKSR
jgi:DNA-binding transcriptional ArsR family regulator